ncbi:uncharacterized protein LOC130996253 [Salvia miltiorrhiza]|uniref:uncharacterized protein LOC130996253 n=1 Tax=Salvia miltiorrhiza TaxID=226208 RepID=UPI0025ABB6A4|nr:uncharacterized protein LOC130996253 [Salvia miltiorrhiza]
MSVNGFIFGWSLTLPILFVYFKNVLCLSHGASWPLGKGFLLSLIISTFMFLIFIVKETRWRTSWLLITWLRDGGRSKLTLSKPSCVWICLLIAIFVWLPTSLLMGFWCFVSQNRRASLVRGFYQTVGGPTKLCSVEQLVGVSDVSVTLHYKGWNYHRVGSFWGWNYRSLWVAKDRRFFGHSTGTFHSFWVRSKLGPAVGCLRGSSAVQASAYRHRGFRTDKFWSLICRVRLRQELLHFSCVSSLNSRKTVGGRTTLPLVPGYSVEQPLDVTGVACSYSFGLRWWVLHISGGEFFRRSISSYTWRAFLVDLIKIFRLDGTVSISSKNWQMVLLHVSVRSGPYSYACSWASSRLGLESLAFFGCSADGFLTVWRRGFQSGEFWSLIRRVSLFLEFWYFGDCLTKLLLHISLHFFICSWFSWGSFRLDCALCWCILFSFLRFLSMLGSRGNLGTMVRPESLRGPHSASTHSLGSFRRVLFFLKLRF